MIIIIIISSNVTKAKTTNIRIINATFQFEDAQFLHKRNWT